MKQVFISPHNNASLSTSSTEHHFIFGAGTPSTFSNGRIAVCPAAGTLRNLKIKISVAPGAAKSYVFTVQKNSVDTGLTVTVSGAADITGEDVTNEVTVAAGDLLSITSAPSGTPTASKLSFSIEFEGDNANQNFVAASCLAIGVSNTTTQYWPIAGMTNAGSTSSAFRGIVIPHDCTLKAVYVKLGSNPGSGNSWEFRIFKNGTGEATSSFTISGVGPTTGNVTGLSIDLAPGDVIALRSVPTSSPLTPDIQIGVLFESDTDGNSIFPNFSDAFSPSATNYNSANNANPLTDPSATEANFDGYVGGSFTLKNLHAAVEVAPASGKSWAFTLRKNTADTTVTASIADANTTANDTTHTADFVSGDVASFKSVPSGTPTGMTAARYSFTQYIASAVTSIPNKIYQLNQAVNRAAYY